MQINFIHSHPSEFRQLFVDFRFPDKKCLVPEKVNEYTAAIQVLEALRKAQQDGRKTFKDNLAVAILYIQENNISLPTNPDRLQRKLTAYIKEGYTSLISKHHGNQRAAKAKNLGLIRQLDARPNNFHRTTARADYNLAAAQLGLPALSIDTIRRAAKAAEWQTLGQKQGMHAWRNTFDVIVGRERPSYPLMLTVHDGFDWELYYQAPVKQPNGKTVVKHQLRKNVVVVVDAFNDYPLGYAIGDGETKALIQQALRNAVLHIAELTGGYYFPWQIKSDRWALEGENGLRGFYDKIAEHVTPAKVGNARDKVIESWFSRFNDEFTSGASDARRGLQQRLNYAGKNFDALKTSQPNRDFLDQHKRRFPTHDECCWQIVNDIEADRNNKREAWLRAWNECPMNDKRPVTRPHYLETFGIKRDRTIQITNQGIVMTHRGQRHQFMMLESDFIKAIGSDCTIYFDEATPESILAYDEKHNKKYLVEAFKKIPMAYRDMQTGDRTRLNRVLELKNEFEREAIESNASDMSKLEAEGLLKTYFTYNGTNKPSLAEAKRALMQTNAGSGSPASGAGGCAEDTDLVEAEFNQAYSRKGSLKPIVNKD